jgi:hypothetical protein
MVNKHQKDVLLLRNIKGPEIFHGTLEEYNKIIQ